MQRMLKLQARRPHLYGTRRLAAGDEYEAPAESAIALVASRKADFAKAKKKEPPAPVAAEKPDPPGPSIPQYGPGGLEPAETPDSIDRLRLEATALGINVDRRWGARRLQYEIEQAKR